MTDQTPDTGAESHGDAQPPGLPRWLKVAALVVGLLILLFVVLQMTGLGPEHGPGMHSP